MAKNTRMERYEQKKTVPKAPPIKKITPVKKKQEKGKKQTVSKKPVTKVPQKKQKVRKIRYKNVFLAFLFLLLMVLLGYWLYSLPVTNLYVEGNSYYSDQEIIEFASLEDYPSFLSTFGNSIETNLKKHELIDTVMVHRWFGKITIKVTEKYPLFYYESAQKTVLSDGTYSESHYFVPTVINYIPDTVYSNFLGKMKQVDQEILNRISEMKYDPDEVDSSRFLLSMNDGNYVYLTLTKWNSINQYLNIIKEFPYKKGILYLNAGNSFEILEN